MILVQVTEKRKRRKKDAGLFKALVTRTICNVMVFSVTKLVWKAWFPYGRPQDLCCPWRVLFDGGNQTHHASMCRWIYLSLRVIYIL